MVFAVPYAFRVDILVVRREARSHAWKSQPVVSYRSSKEVLRDHSCLRVIQALVTCSHRKHLKSAWWLEQLLPENRRSGYGATEH
jgi:hypothetical protein